MTRKGVRIAGAYFPDEINLEDGHLPWLLGLQHSRFENGLNMGGLQAERQVSLEGSAVEGPLNLASASIGEALFMRDATFKEVHLRGAQIKGQLAMNGTTVTDTLDMASISIGRDLLMRSVKRDRDTFKATFGKILLRGAQIKGQLSMAGITVKGTLIMDSTLIEGALLMRSFKEDGDTFKATFGKILLRGAQIKGQLAMIGITVKGTLDMGSVSVDGALLMGSFEEDGGTFKTTFGKILLRGAQIKGQLSMIGTTVKGTLDMGSVSVGGALLMRATVFEEAIRKAQIKSQLMRYATLMRATVFEEVILRGAQIKGQLVMRDATVRGKLDMTSALIGNSLLMDGATFTDVDLGFATIGSILNLTGGTFRTLDLTGTTVEGELRLITEGKSVKWQSDNEIQLNDIQLNLQNTQVGALVDSPKSWPDKIDLRGFTYRQLGGAEQEDEPSERLADVFIKWLGRNETFSFQPYQQLASVLHNAGKSSTADAILFAAKEREREKAKGREKAWLSVLWFVIGYGIGRYTFLALGWAIFVVIVGWSVLICTGEGQKHEKTVTVDEEGTVGEIGFWFSFDYLLPAVRLREAHYTKVDLSYGVRIYFYAHQLIGYILVFFLIAALTGITTPSNGRGPPG